MNHSPIKILVIGAGYVGLVVANCFAALKNQVFCFDKDGAKIKKLQVGQLPFYEPDLEALLQNNSLEKRLVFVKELDATFDQVEVIFIAVGTPMRSHSAKTDLSYLEAAIKAIATSMKSHKIIVIKSTVPPGTTRLIQSMIRKINPNLTFDIVCNPEFLREGSAVYDFMHPDRVVFGIEHQSVKTIMDRLYAAYIEQNIPLLYTNFESAELIKYTANCFLATRIGLINEMANLCEKVGANIDEVIQGIGLDKRIGTAYLKPGPGFGGSCFPKDMLALTHLANTLNMPLRIIGSVINANEHRKKQMIGKIIAACDGTVERKKITILGTSFKANTDDMRDSPSLSIIHGLHAGGATIVIYDPTLKSVKHLAIASDILWGQSVELAIQDADAIVITTEWEAFAHLNFETMKENVVIVDLRNLYDPEKMGKKGLRYVSIGRPNKAFKKTCKSEQNSSVPCTAISTH